MTRCAKRCGCSRLRGHVVLTTFQNISEFWNVCTRPVEARGGFGLTLDETRRRLRAIERIAAILPDSSETYARWRELVLAHEVKGVQVHDAKIVALMLVHGLSNLVTLNSRDFSRYHGIQSLLPEAVLASA